MCSNAIQFQNVGHPSNAVSAYKWTSSEQKIQVSDVLYGSKMIKKAKKDDKEDASLKKEKSRGGNQQQKLSKKAPINISLNFVVN